MQKRSWLSVLQRIPPFPHLMSFKKKCTTPKSFKLDLERLPATTASMKLHIQRSYFLAYLWFHAPFEEVVDINPVEYCYAVDEEDNLFPMVTYGKNVRDDFPMSCNCIKCARDRICPCRILKIACCKFCKCGAGSDCKNPNNI